MAGGFSAGGRRVGGDAGVAAGGPEGAEIKKILPGTLKSSKNELWLDVGRKTWQPDGGFSCSGHKGRMTPGHPLRGVCPQKCVPGQLKMRRQQIGVGYLSENLAGGWKIFSRWS